MISSNDFRPGVTIEYNGDPCQVLEFQHVKPGKGAAFVRTKLKNLKTGATTELTFRGGEKLPKATIDRAMMQYLYFDGEAYVFMDNNTYEQVSLTAEQLQGGDKFLKENMDNLKAEYYIPTMVNKLVSEGTSKMKVLHTDAQWFGVTYKEDRPKVVAKIEELIRQGVYPRSLWK